MPLTTFIASNSKVLSKFIKDACSTHEMDTLSMAHETEVFEELRAAKPDLIFLQASIVDKPTENLIARIKSDERLGEAYIVVFASRPEGAEFAFKVGADAFLPIPFKNEQFQQIMRSILNEPKEILVVSKTEDLRREIEKASHLYDLHIAWAQSAEEAVKFASENFPDLLLCDYELPQRSGAELSALLKHSHLLGHIPVVVMAKSANPRVIEDCFESGANEVFTYPFEPEKHLPPISSIIKPPKKGKRMTALVVDDSVTVRNVISKMFRQLGYVTLTAINGQEALELVAQTKPDIITSDYDMPVMDGWGFCTALRNNPDTAAIPVVMVSSRSTITDKRKARALGVTAYLTKPFTTQDLERIVKLVAAQSQRKKREDRLEKYAGADASSAITAVVYGIKEDPAPEERYATLLSCNIVNFTQKLGWQDANRMSTGLNDYFRAVIERIARAQGTVDSIIGDELLVRFDSSGDRLNDALNAIDAAVSIFEYLDDRNESANESLKVRIGIHSENIVLGNFGHAEHRLAYTMIGAGVGTVRSLQRAASAGGCLLSGDTYAMVADSVGDLPSFIVGLKDETRLTAYRL
jgi:CheY-like chemotaxis protein